MNIQKYRYLIVFICLFFGIVFFLGKTRIILNPLFRYIYLESYIKNIKKDGRIDSVKFWEFRDFYAATSTLFKPENIETNQPFLIYSSPRIQSQDYIVKRSSPTIKQFVIPAGAKLILSTQNEVIYERGSKITIRFVKEINEMIGVNGYSYFYGVNIEKYQDYLWYTETEISK